MKTSTLLLLGAIAYLWYSSKSSVPAQTITPGVGPVQGPPTTAMDPCYAGSAVFDYTTCVLSGREPYAN